MFFVNSYEELNRKKLAALAGISTRILRYYDEIGILKPARINSSYFNKIDALREHQDKLLDKKNQLELLLANVKKTIDMMEGGIIMADKEKFEGYKKKIIEDNELKYGKEIKEKYGNGAIDFSNQKIKNMSEEQYAFVQKQSVETNEAIKAAFEKGDTSSELAQKACELHKKWLLNYWDHYSKEAHMKLVQMYVADERFTAYYDKITPGCAVFLRDAMINFIGKQE